MLAVADYSLELFFTMTETQKMSLVDVQRCDFLEELVECLIAMRDEESTLCGKVMVDVVDDLSGNISLASTRRTDNDRQSRLCARSDCLDLSGSEADRVELGASAGYGPLFGGLYEETLTASLTAA